MSHYNEAFIQSQKETLLKEQTRLEDELKNVATYDAGEGKYRPNFEELNKGDVEKFDEASEEVTIFGENTAVSNELIKSLAAIKSALADIDSGKYGFCENCGEYIPEDRLQAYPAAKVCIKCESNQ